MSESYRHIETSFNQGILVLTVVDQTIKEYELAEGLGRELVDATRKSDAKNVVVVMRNVQVMSSVGYGPFLSLHRHVKDSGGRLVLSDLSDLIRETFSSTRLLINPRSKSSVFEYADSVDRAIESLSA